MTWQQLLKDGALHPYNASRRETGDLLGVVTRNLDDAHIAALSADNRLGLAYEAALVLCKCVVHACGYRVRATVGAHALTLRCAGLGMGHGVADTIEYFDSVPRKRNRLSYDVAGTVGDGEADDVVAQAERFRAAVEGWLGRNYPELV